MAWVIVSMLTLASSLYGTSKDSAKIYSNLQSYRAASELCTYQYLTDLTSVTVEKRLDTDWISIKENAMYSQALAAIQNALADPNDETRWILNTVTDALTGANISDPTILTDLFSKLSTGRQELILKVPEPLTLDWTHKDNWKNASGAHVKIKPFVIETTLNVKGESITEVFEVDELFLDVSVEGNTAILSLKETESGVKIRRAEIEAISSRAVSD